MDCFSCCKCPRSRSKSVGPIKLIPFQCGCNKRTKHIWRLRVNWFYILLLGTLYCISKTSVSSSFHQFVTNPRPEDLNGTLDDYKLEPGLGLSESFYSWILAMFNLGSVIGAVLTGFLIQCIPYWHLFLFGLILHVVGYVLYALAYSGWLIMISKFISGYYLGAQITLALSYASKSSLEYAELLGDKGDKDTIVKTRNLVYVLQSIGISLGYVFGLGAAVVFAQFEISQFRSIAWYNVAIGIAFILLHFVMFHGESRCGKSDQQQLQCFICKEKRCAPCQVPNPGAFSIFIYFQSYRFGVFETLLNPVLSDSFGFDERNASYFFFGVSAAQPVGTLLLMIFEKAKVSSQLMAIIGIVATVVSCVLLTDWQAIPYDPCTEYSPFHHPNISDINNHTTSQRIHIQPPLTLSMRSQSVLEEIGAIQSLQILSNESYYIAKMNCIQANISDHHCQWIPSSTITKKECEDCPPICRSREQTLTFVQFVIGAVIMKVSMPVLWVSTVALVSNQVPKGIEGIVMGILTSMTGLGRSISPLILDAAYEGMGKRTFVAMLLLAGLHLPFLVEIIVFYNRLGYRDDPVPEGYSKIGLEEIKNTSNSESDSDHE